MERTYFIIDDDALQNEIHAILLKKVDPEAAVYTFQSSKAAGDYIDSGKLPDLVFLDLHIPGEDESSFLRKHKTLRWDCDIYLMSSMAYLDKPELTIEFPAIKDFITKPLLDYKLRPIIGQYV